MTTGEPIGFIGLGTMGEPMALNLRRAGNALVVWNRSPQKCERLVAAGASLAANSGEVFARCATVILMMADGAAMDAVLARHTAAFAARVRGHTIVSMATVEPEYSQALAADIHAAGGRYVEAPVSGSRKPAEAGELVAMLAGAPDAIEAVRDLLAPLCRECVTCGAVPGALRMKLAVNVFLITMVTGLAEAAHFAARHDLDMARFAAILNAGPMASAVSRIKLDKLCARDFTRQAGIADVLKNSRLVVEAAHAARIAVPLMERCRTLYARTESLGYAHDDMIAVVHAFDALYPEDPE
ncbi:NAD(P)-dependent oxidoreductase [Paraburkholderia acidisoli]|uniref:NAD-binding protein n=1 Tax=Paraburkholderia acidisoli TaxID=2571748 RepID=A0A7Z2JJD4_9BURK|nr:NAD(P)-dependent oxidoreductase [Paraburkholderia acidisoli]QGZ66681.1 NAD-binding protein [Paraburkholderia acidisoli]